MIKSTQSRYYWDFLGVSLEALEARACQVHPQDFNDEMPGRPRTWILCRMQAATIVTRIVLEGL